MNTQNFNIKDKIPVGVILLNIILFYAAPITWGLVLFVVIADLISFLEFYVKKNVVAPERNILSSEKLQTRRYKR